MPATKRFGLSCSIQPQFKFNEKGIARTESAVLEYGDGRGDWFRGLFDDARLVAATVVDSRPLGPQRDILQLKFLHVSRNWRGCGLGEQLYHAAHAQTG
ncbi:hypothetical protein [Burkholderia pyrrocinia]|uniref:hypothetical protein n=1 Tax=Burkholderia pyrrocinia TaxID=60550 RepID=UPI001F39DD90|nr:hypothetical protein [Burkholderia pyrrocinia]